MVGIIFEVWKPRENEDVIRYHYPRLVEAYSCTPLLLISEKFYGSRSASDSLYNLCDDIFHKTNPTFLG